MNESFVRPWAPKRSWKTTNFFTLGLSKQTELAITTFGAGLPKTDNFTVAFGFKSVFPLLKNRFPQQEFKLTGGYMVPVSMQGRGVGSYGYTHLSGRLPRLKTRLTAGVNAGTHQVFDRDVVTFVGGIEHPITSELQAVVEYYSGTHAFGGMVAGFVYHNHKYDVVLVGGWRVPNNLRSGQPGFIFELGKFIDLYARRPVPPHQHKHHEQLSPPVRTNIH
jgi:hypothetical protein